MEADYGVDNVLIEVVTHDDGLFGLAVTFCLENGKTAVAIFEEGTQADLFVTGILKAHLEMRGLIRQRDHLDTISNAN